MKTILDFRDKYPKQQLFVLGVLFALMVGILDFLTSNSILFAVLYLLPITLIAWFVGGVSVTLMSCLCGILWLAADVASGHFYSHVSTLIWEAAVVLCLFFIVGYSVAVIKKVW
jgi:hypothetical protein